MGSLKVLKVTHVPRWQTPPLPYTMAWEGESQFGLRWKAYSLVGGVTRLGSHLLAKRINKRGILNKAL